MKLRRSVVLAAVAGALVVVACGDDTTTSGPPVDAQDAGDAGDGGKGSLDPATFDRTCTAASDCFLVEPMQDCFFACCGTQAVRDTPQARAEADSASKACTRFGSCTRGCAPVVAACVSGKCEAREVDGG